MNKAEARRTLNMYETYHRSGNFDAEKDGQGIEIFLGTYDNDVIFPDLREMLETYEGFLRQCRQFTPQEVIDSCVDSYLNK